jgi:hypothetical protein
MADPGGEVRQGAERVTWLPLWWGWLRFVIPVVLTLILFRTVPSAVEEIGGAIRDLREIPAAAGVDAPVMEGATAPMEEAGS